MKKNTFLTAGAVALGVFALMSSGNSKAKTKEVKINDIMDFIIKNDSSSGETQLRYFNSRLRLMQPEEISVIHTVLFNYGHVNNAPEYLKKQWKIISEKYDVFT
ncbi:hypothetical protein [Abyssalbus ytuae]|uniref:Uncharacterized protein n=1 Tax=Abyssalbus ytuae TaxID=2926907 RepID=A0A9E7D2V6_9FLAO|nr:hypothetical protein [Abyssalbus ytuae]UOB18578.1 hypothetical protein MQE35_04640 [Abyssalbus ytuae]